MYWLSLSEISEIFSNLKIFFTWCRHDAVVKSRKHEGKHHKSTWSHMMPHDAAIFYNKKYIYFLLKNSGIMWHHVASCTSMVFPSCFRLFHNGIMTASWRHHVKITGCPSYIYTGYVLYFTLVRFNIYGIIKVDISYLFVLHETGVNVYLSNPFKTFGCVGILLVGPVPFSKILFEHL